MQNKLPADPSALIIGIVGIVIGFAGCCCYGFTAIIPLILSIWGLVEANKSLKLYNEDPSVYSESSRSNVGISKVLNIISIIMNSLFILVVIGFIAFVGLAGLQGAFEDVTGGAYPSSNEWEYEENEDSEYEDEDVYKVEEVDTLIIDEINLETDTLNN